MRAAAPSVDPFLVTVFAGLPTLVFSVAVTLLSSSRRARLAGLFRRPEGRRLFAGLAAVGLTMYAVGNPLFVKALALGGATVATPAGNTVVIWSALLGAALLGERLNRTAWAGVGVFISGILLLSWGQGADVPVGPGWFWAVPLGAAAGFTWSLGGVGTRLAHGRGVDSFAILSAFSVAGLGAVGAVVAATGKMTAFARWAGSHPDALPTVLAMVSAGLFNVVAQVSLTAAFYHETVARVSVISSSSVTIVAVLAWALLGDALNPTMFAGILAVFAGAAMVQAQAGGPAVAGTGAPPGGAGPAAPCGPSPPKPTKRQEEMPAG
jgi:drug/metabolite transporter (DMT)-like permease